MCTIAGKSREDLRGECRGVIVVGVVAVGSGHGTVIKSYIAPGTPHPGDNFLRCEDEIRSTSRAPRLPSCCWTFSFFFLLFSIHIVQVAEWESMFYYENRTDIHESVNKSDCHCKSMGVRLTENPVNRKLEHLYCLRTITQWIEWFVFETCGSLQMRQLDGYKCWMAQGQKN